MSDHAPPDTVAAQATVPPEHAAEHVLALALTAGASAAEVRVNDSESLSVTIRGGKPDERAFRHAHGISVTLYRGQRCATVASSDLSGPALQALIARGLEIAAITAEDACVGLPSSADVAAPSSADALDLDHPWDLSLHDAVTLASRIEAAALAVDPRVPQTEGASVSSARTRHWLANSDGLALAGSSTSHSLACSPVAIHDGQKQVDGWWDTCRRATDLSDPEALGRHAAKRALARLGAKPVPTRTCPVLFDPSSAIGLLGDYLSAATAGRLYLHRSFLGGALGKPLFAPHVRLDDDPFVVRGIGSRAWDGAGLATRARTVVRDGVLDAYFVDLYGSRRLGVALADHCIGPTNLRLSSSLTRAGDDWPAMLARLGTGLVVGGMTGQGVNPLTGDFSRAVHGFWVEGGEIRHPVAGVTVASNLLEMACGLVAVGADALTRGNVTTGSWLIDAMRVGGA
ncbi:TldD/PmbA family protein [Burkholderia sp. 22PA0099]|uniref:TldD/PmbA family protein n=1 Tax=Burkholderia sp. 22PA0099 TaxID=3237372 RepID=UPI0039C2E8C8